MPVTTLRRGRSGSRSINAAIADDLIALRTPVSIPDATTYTVLAENSGRDHIFPDFTSSCTITLPAAAEGLRYRFLYGGVAADAQNCLIDTGPTTDPFLGAVLWLDSDNTGNNVGVVASDGNDDDVLTMVTPAPGTMIDLYCDGDKWRLLFSVVVSATTPTFG